MSQVRKCETPEDKVVEILSKLPPKSLIRFKCIRKSWCTIINSPSFVAKHLRISMDNKLSSTTCILLNRCQVHVFPDRSWKQDVFWSMTNLSIDSDEHNLHYDVEDLNIPFPMEDQDNVEIHGYCNGIVCVIVGKNVLLCNPATREFRQLPNSSLLLPLPKGRFGLETTFKGMGFGYDCKTKEYKVVRIIENCDCEYSEDGESYYERILLPHTAEVYTTTANSWKEIKIDISIETRWYCIPYSCSVYLKGFCYWFAYDNGEYVFSFDLGDEIFHRIELPSRRESDFKFYGIFLYNESVTSYCYRHEEDCELFEIWVMDDYDGVKSSWTKQLTIGPLKDIDYPLTLWKCDEILMLGSYGRAASCNSSTGNLKYLHIPPIINWMIDYVKSIVPVK
ncbi:F-box protein CPR30-like [Malus domestica]|uniref:S-locus F-box brothers-like protein n=1 Tax=Malus domestica TaxID=3750 RepID=E0XL42_MALDO|nr:F-box protein CPR30-like [Malus domestica]ADM53764.1 S-locus F-box brothers-like protein [Malus domestica]